MNITTQPFRWTLAALLGLGAVLAGRWLISPAASQGSSPQGPLGSYRIVGYQPDWESTNPIRYDHLTHLNYAFLEANADGSLKTANMRLSRMKTIITEAHAAGVKVLISVGGAANREPFGAAATGARETLIANLEGFAETYGFDGIDLDWEGPQSDPDGAAYLALVQKLSSDLHVKGKLLTTALARWLGEFIPSEAFAALDFVNLMAYDDECNAQNAFNHSSLEKARTDLTYFAARGLPPSKTVLGVPFYGYDLKGCKTYSGIKYVTIVARDSSAAQKDSSNGVNYNGIPTIKEKAALAMRSASGIMIWELSQDTMDEGTSLLTAIYDTLTGKK